MNELNADGTLRLDGSLMDKADKKRILYFLNEDGLNSNQLELMNIEIDSNLWEEDPLYIPQNRNVPSAKSDYIRVLFL